MSKYMRMKPHSEWQKDEDAPNCTACKTQFNFLVRRHHCRKCLKIFCDSCTSSRVPMLDENGVNLITNQRCCMACVSAPSDQVAAALEDMEERDKNNSQKSSPTFNQLKNQQNPTKKSISNNNTNTNNNANSDNNNTNATTTTATTNVANNNNTSTTIIAASALESPGGGGGDNNTSLDRKQQQQQQQQSLKKENSNNHDNSRDLHSPPPIPAVMENLSLEQHTNNKNNNRKAQQKEEGEDHEQKEEEEEVSSGAVHLRMSSSSESVNRLVPPEMKLVEDSSSTPGGVLSPNRGSLVRSSLAELKSNPDEEQQQQVEGGEHQEHKNREVVLEGEGVEEEGERTPVSAASAAAAAAAGGYGGSEEGAGGGGGRRIGERNNNDTNNNDNNEKSNDKKKPAAGCSMKDPRRVYTRSLLHMLVSPHWVQLRTPSHQLAVPDIVASEVEIYSLDVPGTRTKAYRLTVDIDATLVAASMLLSSVDLMSKCEPDVESRSVVATEDHPDVLKIATRYKSTSFISGREFRTKSASHEISDQEVASLATLALNEMPVAGFVTGAINDQDPQPTGSSSSSDIVVGVVHCYGIAVSQIKQLNPVRRSHSILRVSFLSHTDPKGRLPLFALETPTIQDLIHRLNLFCAALHSLDLTVTNEDDLFVEEADKAILQARLGNQNSATAAAAAASVVQPSAAATASVVADADSLAEAGVIPRRLASSLAESYQSAQGPSSSLSGSSSSTSTLCPSRRKVLAPLLKLYNFAHWEPVACKEAGLTVATAAVPRSRVKAHKVTATISCSLFTFAEIVGDASLVSKYDPNIDVFEATRTVNSRVSSIYSSYKKANRLIDSRDFAVASAHVFIGREELAQELPTAPAGTKTAFLQNVVDSHIIPPRAEHVRGIVHTFGYVATSCSKPVNKSSSSSSSSPSYSSSSTSASVSAAAASAATSPSKKQEQEQGEVEEAKQQRQEGEEQEQEQEEEQSIRVTLVACVDPCGNIPTFLLDSQTTESIRKLVAIKTLCEERQMTSPARSRSVEHFGSLDSSRSSLVSFHQAHEQEEEKEKQQTTTAATTSYQAVQSQNLSNFGDSPPPSPKENEDEDAEEDDNNQQEPTATENKKEQQPEESKPATKLPSKHVDSLRSLESGGKNDHQEGDDEEYDDDDDLETVITSYDEIQAEEQARDDVLAAVIDLQRAQGWGASSQIQGCRVESRVTALADVKAVRTYKEVKCTLDTFRSKLLDIDTLQALDSSLEQIEFLLSPNFGQIVFTAHKSNSVFVSPREFCTLNCHRLLSGEEAANSGLCTPGMPTAVFVSASIDAPPGFSRADVLPNHVRGKVYAFGYVALATPPTAKRIRVFNIALVDPCGSIPAKVVEFAISENATRLSKLAAICENVSSSSSSSSLNTQQQVPNNAVTASAAATAAAGGGDSKQKEELEEEESEVIPEMQQDLVDPLLNLSASTRLPWVSVPPPPSSSSSSHSSMNFLKIERVAVGPHGSPPVVFRVKLEIKASLQTLSEALSSSSHQGLSKLLQPQSIKFLKLKEQKQQEDQKEEGESDTNNNNNNNKSRVVAKVQLPSNVLGYRHSRTTTIVSESRLLDEKEGPKHQLFTEGFHGAAFVWSGQSPPLERIDEDDDEQEEKGSNDNKKKKKKQQEEQVTESFTELLGCIAVAVPVNAKRLRCQFWWSESLYLPHKDVAEISDVDQAANHFSQGVSRFTSYVEGVQKTLVNAPAPSSSSSPSPSATSSNNNNNNNNNNNSKSQAETKSPAATTVVAQLVVATAATTTPPSTPLKTQQQQQQEEEEEEKKQEEKEEQKQAEAQDDEEEEEEEYEEEIEEEIPVAEKEEEEEKELPPRALPLGSLPQQERILKPLLDLCYANNNKWSSPPKEAHGCTLQEVSVPFCDKKALKMEIVMRCSMFTFARFLHDESLIPKYDPSMEQMKIVSSSNETRCKTIYTSYKKSSAFITARDFAFDSTLAVLSSEDPLLLLRSKQQQQQKKQDHQEEVLVSSNIHNSKAVPDKSGFVRGILHAYGYIVQNEDTSVAAAVSGGKIRVTCICCVDPSGRIPASLVDAAATENCRKLAVIRQIVEAMHSQSPLIDWFFDVKTGKSTIPVSTTSSKPKASAATSAAGTISSSSPSEEKKVAKKVVVVKKKKKLVVKKKKEQQQQEEEGEKGNSSSPISSSSELSSTAPSSPSNGGVKAVVVPVSSLSEKLGGPIAMLSEGQEEIHEEDEEEEEKEEQAKKKEGESQQQQKQQQKEEEENVVMMKKSVIEIAKQRTISAGATQEQMKVLQPLLDLYRATKWSSPPKEAHGCLLQDMTVPFCDKKAMRMEIVMKCSIFTFAKVLANPAYCKRYDPSLLDLKRVNINNNNSSSSATSPEDVLSYHSTYTQPSRFISARDFAFDTALTVLNAKQVQGSILNSISSSSATSAATGGGGNGSAVDPEGVEVLVNSAVHNPKFPAVNGYVRGILHVYGYLAYSLPSSHGSSSKTRIICLGCVDPSGRIPASFVDAVASENCKKLATIRSICEDVEMKEPARDWYF